MRFYVRVLVVVAAFVAIATLQVCAKGTLQNVAHFTNQTVEFDLDQYTAENGTKVGLFGLRRIGPAEKWVTLALDVTEWPRLQKMLAAARDADVGSRKTIGTIVEDGTKAQCVLVVHGGTSLQFTIVDAEQATSVVYVMPREQIAAALAGAERLRVFLATP